MNAGRALRLRNLNNPISAQGRQSALTSTRRLCCYRVVMIATYAKFFKMPQTSHNVLAGQVVLLPVGLLLPLAGSARVLDA